ncbi:unnamed protein product [Nesidiocoris tenuis]|uniref:Uncharacterized protein n=1 Tax=Nesidiocoris tenuis TaxID=355587 RepID=A0A6H5HJU3_9HEMI|nr:unnamed protein product [Nesidiocoris tenuis]
MSNLFERGCWRFMPMAPRNPQLGLNSAQASALCTRAFKFFSHTMGAGSPSWEVSTRQRCRRGMIFSDLSALQ